MSLEPFATKTFSILWMILIIDSLTVSVHLQDVIQVLAEGIPV